MLATDPQRYFTERQMLDRHALLPPVGPVGGSIDGPPLEQQSGIVVRLLRLELWRRAVVGHDRVVGHRDLGGAHQSMYLVILSIFF